MRGIFICGILVYMDAVDMIQQTKMCVYMTQGYSYSTSSGIEFTPEQPFQMMDGLEGNMLITDMPYRFRIAEKEEVVEFFSKNKSVGPKRMTMV